MLRISCSLLPLLVPGSNLDRFGDLRYYVALASHPGVDFLNGLLLSDSSCDAGADAVPVDARHFVLCGRASDWLRIPITADGVL